MPGCDELTDVHFDLSISIVRTSLILAHQTAFGDSSSFWISHQSYLKNNNSNSTTRMAQPLLVVINPFSSTSSLPYPHPLPLHPHHPHLLL